MKTARNNPLDIRHISLRVTELIKQYAVVNNCTQDEMLERIVLEWNSQQSESERPSGDEDE
ncbi:hypothetical protein [uncultured Nostoc sp.]|uniref:hypothetical protein n=1 Tax=uncultured Nostoc sp. TaxID=340711 RepID=UPI0035CB51CC